MKNSDEYARQMKATRLITERRNAFMKQFYQLPDYVDLVGMFDLIEEICLATGKPASTIKAWAKNGCVPQGGSRETFDRLKKLMQKTGAWIVEGDDGHYRIERRIFEAVVLNEDWEMDNLAWVVDDGAARYLRTTTCGGECEMTLADLTEKIAETKDSLDGLRQAAKLMGW